MLDIHGSGSVTVVVGANNVGKSQLLEQVRQLLYVGKLTRSSEGPHGPRIVTEISQPWSGSVADLEAWIRTTSVVSEARGIETAYRPHINPTQMNQLREVRRHPTPRGATDWFVGHQTPTSFPGGVQPTARADSTGQPPSSPLQQLHVDRGKLALLKRAAARLFGLELFLDVVSNQLTLRIGTPAVEPYLVDDYNPEYDKAVAALPEVRSQGDGICSAIGLLVPLIANLRPLVLLDEPETFLHPPQAQTIGREIGRAAKVERAQVIVATHDKNVLQGLIESNATVTILHLTREGDSAHAQVLKPEDVSELWADPILRYTNALDGLFHSAVIITEGERDAHFYNAAIDYVLGVGNDDVPAHNIMFVGVSGKTNIARIAGRLQKLGVRAVSCPDLDVLNDEHVLSTLVEAHGGTWGAISKDYHSATNQFKDAPSAPAIDAIKQRVDEILASDPQNQVLTKRLASELREAVKLPSGTWSQLKAFGFSAFKQDKAAAGRLFEHLESLGIVPVKVGELENFVTSTSPPKGPAFLSVAFREHAHTSAQAIEQAERLLRAAGIPLHHRAVAEVGID